jgi:hypothetical protein
VAGTSPSPYTLTLKNLSNSDTTILDISNSNPLGLIILDTGGTCPVSSGVLATHSSCTLKVKPTGSLNNTNKTKFTNTVTVTFTDPSTEESASANQDTVVSTLTAVSVSGDPTIDLGNLATLNTGSFTVTNNGPYTWRPSHLISDYILTGASANKPGIEETGCLAETEIEPGSSCEVSIKTDNSTDIAIDDHTMTIINNSANTNLFASSIPHPYHILPAKAVIEWSKTLPMTLAPGATEVEHPSYVISNPELTDRLMANKTYTYSIKNIGGKPLTFDANAVTVNGSDNIIIGNNHCNNASLAKDVTCSFDITGSSQASASIGLQLTTADADIANPEDKILSDVKIIPGTVICSEVPVDETFTLDGDTTHYFVVTDGTSPSGIKNDNIYDHYIDSDMNKVCTTHVTDMSDLFHGSTFNRNIDDWDTSNVNDMSFMFFNSYYFDQPLNHWDTS